MRVWLLLATLVAFTGYVGWQHVYLPPVGAAVPEKRQDAARPLVVKIHDDFSSTCVELGPTWSRLGAQVGDSARLVVLDVTDPQRAAAAQRVARYLGVTDFLEQHRADTGMIAVFHGATREPVAVFHGERDVGAYVAAIEQARRG
jgi:hypothetical protein